MTIRETLETVLATLLADEQATANGEIARLAADDWGQDVRSALRPAVEARIGERCGIARFEEERPRAEVIHALGETIAKLPADEEAEDDEYESSDDL